MPGQPSRRAVLAQSGNAGPFGDDYDGYGGGLGGAMPLMSKQAIIVLREELEYFSIPTKGTEAAKAALMENLNGRGNDISVNDVSTPALLKLKNMCGAALLERRQIFTALQRNVNKENNMAEQHLIDMLCMR